MTAEAVHQRAWNSHRYDKAHRDLYVADLSELLNTLKPPPLDISADEIIESCSRQRDEEGEAQDAWWRQRVQDLERAWPSLSEQQRADAVLSVGLSRRLPEGLPVGPYRHALGPGPLRPYGLFQFHRDSGRFPVYERDVENRSALEAAMVAVDPESRAISIAERHEFRVAGDGFAEPPVAAMTETGLLYRIVAESNRGRRIMCWTLVGRMHGVAAGERQEVVAAFAAGLVSLPELGPWPMTTRCGIVGISVAEALGLSR